MTRTVVAGAGNGCAVTARAGGFAGGLATELGARAAGFELTAARPAAGAGGASGVATTPRVEAAGGAAGCATFGPGAAGVTAITAPNDIVSPRTIDGGALLTPG